MDRFLIHNLQYDNCHFVNVDSCHFVNVDSCHFVNFEYWKGVNEKFIQCYSVSREILFTFFFLQSKSFRNYFWVFLQKIKKILRWLRFRSVLPQKSEFSSSLITLANCGLELSPFSHDFSVGKILPIMLAWDLFMSICNISKLACNIIMLIYARYIIILTMLT